jgi:hypothetical protein
MEFSDIKIGRRYTRIKNTNGRFPVGKTATVKRIDDYRVWVLVDSIADVPGITIDAVMGNGYTIPLYDFLSDFVHEEC